DARPLPAFLATTQHQPDPDAGRRRRQPMRRQAVISPADELHQLRALACKLEGTAKELMTGAQQSTRALPEGIGHDIELCYAPCHKDARHLCRGDRKRFSPAVIMR